ncbi:peroxisome proliferator-activated receptor gamma coactivator-related protein 1 isoform X2 [Microcaecilia unicolor]|uniref:Peroxisome proliferator-activated receptor gamma coactivator-related protein 1 isoform X2 n=1 Tax=Microcaecilia unicolor TaxID=1415580 RepID=A0A6P7Y6I4_9AMPH|nr:peroxisome proliferator-activated receptor gamma coactivator-related protein 1 isoform X2 [Microcaecilia unicolor]
MCLELFVRPASCRDFYQCHTFSEDEICAGLPDLSMPSLDTGEILGTFQGYVDTSIISIIDDPSSQGEHNGCFEDNELSLLTALTEILDSTDDENVSPFDTITDAELLTLPKDRDNSVLQKFLNLSRSPMEREVFCSDNQLELRTDGNCGIFGKVESHSADENWDVFPICLDNLSPVRCSKSRNMWKSVRNRVPEGPTQQRSDGEEEIIHSSKQDHSSEASREFVNFGIEYSDMVNDSRQPKSKSGQRTPCVVNTEKVTLRDLVKYMHSYCLPTIAAVCVETENEEINEEYLNNSVVLEIMASEDDAAMPLVVQLSEPGFAECGTEVQAEEEKDNVIKDTSPELTGGSKIQADRSGMKHDAASQDNETDMSPRGAPGVRDGELPQQVEPEVDVQEKPIAATLVKQVKVYLHSVKSEVEVGENSLKSEVEVEYKSLSLPMEPEVETEPTFVENKSEIQPEALCQKMELKSQLQETTLKCEPRIEPGANSQATDPEEHGREIPERKVIDVKHHDERRNVDIRNLGFASKQLQNDAKNGQRRGRSKSRLKSKRSFKKKNEGIQNGNKIDDSNLPSKSGSLQEIVESKTKLQKVNQHDSSHAIGPFLQESDFLVKQLEKIKSEMELRSIKACRVKGKARVNMESSLIVNCQDRKAPLETESDPEKSVTNDSVKSCLVTKEAKRPPDHALNNKEQISSVHMVETQVLTNVTSSIDTGPKSSMHQENISNEAVPLAPPKEVGVEIEENDMLSKQPRVEDNLNIMQPAKDTKPKSLSLKEYRMRMQQRKPNAEEKAAKEKIATNKWPSVPEPPTELAEIPCLLVSGSAAGSLLTKPTQTKAAQVVGKICKLEKSEKVLESPTLTPLIINTSGVPPKIVSEVPPKIVSKETNQQKPDDHYSSRSSLGVTVPEIAHCPAPYPPYPIPHTWPCISTQPINFPCLPPLPVVPGIASGCLPNTVQPVSVPPPPVPPIPVSTWLPPPFVPPPPPIGTVPANAYGAQGWGSVLPPLPPYWSTTPVPPVIFNDGALPLQNPARISFPVDATPNTFFQRVDHSRSNTVNINSTDSLLQHEKQKVAFQEEPILAHDLQSRVGSNQNKQVQIVEEQKARNSNASEVKHMGPAEEGKIELLQSTQVNCSSKEEVKINSETSATDNCSIHESVLQNASMKTLPGKVASPKKPVENLAAQSYSTGTDVHALDPKSANNVVYKIMELLKKMSKHSVSAESQTTQGTMDLVPDALKFNPVAPSVVPAKSQHNLEAAVSAKPRANPAAMMVAAAIPSKPQMNLGITMSAAHPFKPLTTTGVKTEAVASPAKLPTTTGVKTEAAALPAKPSTTTGIKTEAAPPSAKPPITTGVKTEATAPPAKPPTTTGVKTKAAAPPGKPPTTKGVKTEAAAPSAKPPTTTGVKTEEMAAPAKPPTTTGVKTEAAVAPAKPPTTTGVKTEAAAPPAKPLTTMGLKTEAAAPAKPPTTTGIKTEAAAPAKPPTTTGVKTEAAAAAAPAKPPTTTGLKTEAAAPAKPPTTTGIKTEAAAPQAKLHTVASVQKATRLKKSRKDIKQDIVNAFISEIGIEASDLTSLLEQFEESEAKEEVCRSQTCGKKLAVGHSELESQGEKKPCNKLLAPELASTAGLTPPATPPHQLWKPLAATSLLGKVKPLNTAPQERTGSSSFTSVKLIEAKSLPQDKLHSRNSLPVVAPIHVGHGDHDYCVIGISQTKRCPDVTLPVAEGAPEQLNTQTGKGTRLNVKHLQTITIKPIMSLKERLQNKVCPKQVTVAGCPSVSANHCSKDASTHRGEHAIRNDCTDQLDHRTSEKSGIELDKSHSESVLLSPESSPCRSDDMGVRRTCNLRGNASVSKRPLRCYRKRRHSPSPQASRWRSRRAHTSRSCSSCSDSDGELSSSSSSSSSSSLSRRSHSRSRSTSSKRRKRYRSRSSCSSRYSSQSSSRSRSKSRGRSSSSSSRCSSRSYSTSYSRSRSRSRSPYSRHYRRHSRRYRFYDSRDSYQREKLYHKERAIEERRVVYVGKIHSRMTRSELKHRFSVFGDVEDCTIHFRETGDNYGFVTYRYTEEAFTALENGHKLQYPGELPFDLCFGGRRQFCKSNYADLDSNKDDFDPAHMRNKFDSLDFDTLLKQAQKSHRR